MNDELIAILYDSRLEIDSYQESIDKILKLFTPKLNWKHLYENVWIGKTPFNYTYTLHLEEDGLWKVHKLTYTGTLDECKKECEKIFMETYLSTCE